MLNKNIQKMKLRKNKRVKDEKKVAERERMLPRNRQVQNYYMKKLLGILVLGLLKSYPIDYWRTCTSLVPKEIKPQFSLVKILMLA